jgi:hypothetical protein
MLIEKREAFELNALVYCSSKWYRPSACVWADGRIPIPDRTGISLQYPTLEQFFKTMLRVKAPDMSMHVQALAKLGQSETRDPARIKEAILLISSLIPTEADLHPLSASNIFHVRLANGNFQWTNRAGDFSINDRPYFAQGFRSRIALLDFTLEEVRSSDPFFRALGMANKYLSTSVSESTQVTGGNRHPGLTQSLQSRAFAICR